MSNYPNCNEKPRQNNRYLGNIIRASEKVVTPCIEPPKKNMNTFVRGGTNARFLQTDTDQFVDIFSSPPNVGDLLVATSATTAEWSPGGGGGGAPINATYVTLSPNAVLTNERILASQPAITLTDGGPNANITLDLSNTGVVPGVYTNTTVTVDVKGRITNISNGVPGGTSQVFMAYATTNQSVTTDTNINWLVENATDANFTHAPGSSDITINSTGTYSFNIDVTLVSDGSGTLPGSVRSQILVNPLGGGIFSPLSGTLTCTTIYPIAAIDLHATSTINYTVDFNATDIIRVQSGTISGDGTGITTLANASRITITRIA